MPRVLVVEDSPTQAEALRMILESDGLEAETAPDGQKGLERFRAAGFDLVLSDILMPRLSGYELCRAIKADPRGQDVPVILLTTLNNPMDIIEGLESGADNFITKPVEAAYLLDRVKNVLTSKAMVADGRLTVGVDILFMGRTFTITSEKQQILGLLIATFEDIVRTNRELRASQAELAAAKARLELVREQAARAEAEAAERRAAFLAEVSARLADSLDYEATLATVARLMVAEFADCCVVDLLEADQSMRRVTAVHRDPAKAELVLQLQRYSPDPGGPHPITTVLRTGQPQLLPEVPDALLETIARTPEHVEILRQLAPRSLLSVPLVARGRTLGVLTFVAAESARRYGRADLALAEDLARRAALSIDNARLHREAQEAVRVREEFLARASHELRTPLTVVKGHLALLDKRLAGREPEAASLVSVARRNVDRMVRLIADLLDAFRLAAGRLVLESESLEFKEVVGEAVAQVGPLAHAKGVALIDEVAGGLALVGDRLKLEQVVINLLTNAIKHTAAGGTIRVEGAAAGEELELRVRDTGEGIPAEHLERVFEPFFQVASVAGRQKTMGQGAGLGLTLVRGMVTLHGGQVRAESAGPGRGSTFIVRLPTVTSAGQVG